MRVVELQAVQVELDGGPGVRGNEIGEVVGELRCGQFVDPMVKVVANAANGARVRLAGGGILDARSAKHFEPVGIQAN